MCYHIVLRRLPATSWMTLGRNCSIRHTLLPWKKSAEELYYSGNIWESCPENFDSCENSCSNLLCILQGTEKFIPLGPLQAEVCPPLSCNFHIYALEALTSYTMQSRHSERYECAHRNNNFLITKKFNEEYMVPF